MLSRDGLGVCERPLRFFRVVRVFRAVRGLVLEHPTFGELAFEYAAFCVAAKDAKPEDHAVAAQDHVAVMLDVLEVLGGEREWDASDVLVGFFEGEVDDVFGGEATEGKDGIGGDLGL